MFMRFFLFALKKHEWRFIPMKYYVVLRALLFLWMFMNLQYQIDFVIEIYAPKPVYILFGNLLLLAQQKHWC